MSGRLRAVPDEPEGMFAVSGAAHVGTEERRGRALLLGIPQCAVAGEIGVRNIVTVPLLQVLEKAGPANLDFILGFAAIEEVQARSHGRITVGMAAARTGRKCLISTTLSGMCYRSSDTMNQA